MRLVKPSFEILAIDANALERIEVAGRTCYKSEEKMTSDSSLKFVKSLLTRGHLSVIEHANATVRFVVDRGVSHELVRHRLCSFSQECLSGDTEIRKGLTIRDLVERAERDCYGRTHNKTLHLRSVDDVGTVIPNVMHRVWRKGIAEVFLVTTSLGYRIKATLNHRFLTPGGTYERLGSLVVGNSVMVNGRPSLVSVADDEIEDLFCGKDLSPDEIASRLECPVSSVRRKLKQMGIFVKRRNDKHPEKYNKGQSAESLEKMRVKIIVQYKAGRQPWNKGLSEEDHPSVARQGESLRRNHHNNQVEFGCSTWKGGVSRGIAYRRTAKEKVCCLCNSCGKLHRHHLDRNPRNNSRDNLLTVCISCHALLHHGWYVGKKIIADHIVSVTLVGVEEVFDIEMVEPYDNFVADGFVVHNSTRYCNYKGGVTFVIPPWTHFSEGERDGMELLEKWKKYLYNSDDVWLLSLARAERSYLDLLKFGWTPQQARSVLPNSLKTEIVVTANMREWRHIFDLRTSAAHPQMQEIMKPLLHDFVARIPVLFDDIARRFLEEDRCQKS